MPALVALVAGIHVFWLHKTRRGWVVAEVLKAFGVGRAGSGRRYRLSSIHGLS
jgi:hypothetical protein